MESTHSAPSGAGGKVVAPATKGDRFSIARKGGCLVLYKLAPNFFEGAYHGLCPLREATQPLARATAQGHTPLCGQRPQAPSGIQPTTPLSEATQPFYITCGISRP